MFIETSVVKMENMRLGDERQWGLQSLGVCTECSSSPLPASARFSNCLRGL